jgi:phage-related minor tail protein
MKFFKTLILSLSLLHLQIQTSAQLVVDKVKPVVVDFNKNTGAANVCEGTAKTGSQCQKGIEQFGKGNIWETLGTFLLNISQSLSVLAIFIAVLAIVYAGVLMVSDNGGGENVGKAKKIIANAVIGLVISLLAFTIVYLVASITSSPTLLQNVFK